MLPNKRACHPVRSTNRCDDQRLSRYGRTGSSSRRSSFRHRMLLAPVVDGTLRRTEMFLLRNVFRDLVGRHGCEVQRDELIALCTLCHRTRRSEQVLMSSCQLISGQFFVHCILLVRVKDRSGDLV